MGLSVVIPSKSLSNLNQSVAAVRLREDRAKLFVIDDGIAASPGDCMDCWLCNEDPMDNHIAVIQGARPFVFARNCNLGIRSAGTDDVILLNDDALLKTPGGFSAMQKAAEEHPEYGLISATTNIAGNPEQFQRNGSSLRECTRSSVAFVCVLIPRRTIEAVGLLDECFTAYGWEDNDYCRRIRNAGLKVGIFDGCFVDHASLKSTFRGNPRAAGDISAGAQIYRAKWGDLH